MYVNIICPVQVFKNAQGVACYFVYGLFVCTGDKPFTKALGLSSRTHRRTRRTSNRTKVPTIVLT